MEEKPTLEEYIKAVTGAEWEEVPPDEAKWIQEGCKKFLERLAREKGQKK